MSIEGKPTNDNYIERNSNSEPSLDSFRPSKIEQLEKEVRDLQTVTSFEKEEPFNLQELYEHRESYKKMFKKIEEIVDSKRIKNDSADFDSLRRAALMVQDGIVHIDERLKQLGDELS